jgi:hypothetical protein
MTMALRLAQAVDLCLQEAERAFDVPGSIISSRPTAARRSTRRPHPRTRRPSVQATSASLGLPGGEPSLNDVLEHAVRDEAAGQAHPPGDEQGFRVRTAGPEHSTAAAC